MKPSFVFKMLHERSQSKTITSHCNKALSVQQWQENCAFRQKTLYTLEMENELFFWLMSIRYTVHSDKWGETTRYGEKKLQQKTVPWNINAVYLLTSYSNRQASSGTAGRERELALDWQPLGAEAHARGVRTRTKKHTHTRTCEIMTGQQQGQPFSYLLRTLTAMCILRMPETWQRHVVAYICSSQYFFSCPVQWKLCNFRVRGYYVRHSPTHTSAYVWTLSLPSPGPSPSPSRNLALFLKFQTLLT